MPKMIYICSMRILFLCSLIGLSALGFAQIPNPEKIDNLELQPRSKPSASDSLINQIYQPTINDYLFCTEHRKKIPFDTTLSLGNQYRYTQFNNQSNFRKQPFNNIGQPFNTLIFEQPHSRIMLLPFGKEQVYVPADSVRYFDVKTPTTEFVFHNGMREGQGLRTLFTHNINQNLNYSLEYRGIRSLGHYLESEVDSRNFIATIKFQNKNKKYQLWVHYYNLNNGAVENAGIKNRSDFTSNDPNYRNRQRLLVNLSGARSKYLNKRYYIGQSYNILSQKDSTNQNNFLLKNIFTYQSNSFRFFENQSNTYYLDIANYIENANLQVNKFNKIFENYSSLSFDIKDKFAIEAGLKFQNIKYFFQDPIIENHTMLPTQINDNRVGIMGTIKGNFSKNFSLFGFAEFMNGNTMGTTFRVLAKAKIDFNTHYSLQIFLHNQNRPPALNLLMNNSFYDQFNYYLSDFKNENYASLGATLLLNKWKSKISTQAHSIENYTFLNYQGQSIQSQKSTQILQIQLENILDYKKFHLHSQWVFQNVSSNAEVLPLPSFIAQLNAFYKSMMFKNAANVQIGLKAKFFSQFESREYFPVVNEFKLQDTENTIKVGNYPVLDFYFDMRVKSMQIYLEAQHFNSFFTGRNYFATPNIPMYDFRLNIGLVWYLFT